MGDSGIGSSEGLAFIRITMLGLSGSGKSSLTSVIVQNLYPRDYVKTEDSQLHYLTVKVGGNDGPDDQAFNALLEIEDTRGSDRTQPEDLENFFDLWFPDARVEAKTLEEKEEKDEKWPGPGEKKRSFALPFGRCVAPTIATKPRTQNRMAYWIVFDVTKQESFEAAMGLHSQLDAYWKKKEYKQKGIDPYVYLIGNKSDMLRSSELAQKIHASAVDFSEKNSLNYDLVSAMLCKDVKKALRTTVSAVRIKQQLWMPTFKENDAADLLGSKCSVQ